MTTDNNTDPRLETKTIEVETFDLLQAGYTVDEACAMTGMDWAEFNDYRKSGARRRIDDRRIGRALAMVNNGRSQLVACMLVGISQATLSNNRARAIAGLKQIREEAAAA